MRALIDYLTLVNHDNIVGIFYSRDFIAVVIELATAQLYSHFPEEDSELNINIDALKNKILYFKENEV